MAFSLIAWDLGRERRHLAFLREPLISRPSSSGCSTSDLLLWLIAAFCEVSPASPLGCFLDSRVGRTENVHVPMFILLWRGVTWHFSAGESF